MPNRAKQGNWAPIHQILLKSDQRTEKILNDLKEVPLQLWVKELMQGDASMNATRKIELAEVDFLSANCI